ncbi:hypothetical protein HS088_TW13G00240 [Tripterygium wilfordii]|uniref:Uncharacterized protein n=1 Tax=Tripterygium wilfordii TaxID=458696 RepID=A0A7J7CTG1_TRIWF|nr:uncharacterized protein LOC120012020 [Tripterygium wilfordii]XP_038719171.1 uncharacterized protein LOC120012020 [Tripterygium wilfordii]XP_038719172.1 uncharacterized protein LOC120012020 [Tripterygium wilfordii]KAF5737361.1 hypothetical protein HS088_TW13G00240 [Tripterygium wilfordii]
MNTLFSPSTFLLPLPSRPSFPFVRTQPLHTSLVHHRCFCGCLSSLSVSFWSSLGPRRSSIACTTPSNEGSVSVVNFEDFVEKDWSFLDSDDLNSNEENNQKIGRIISAGGIDETSRVLISIGSEEFVDQLVSTSPCKILFVVHDSLFLLACVKEKYDNVKCWQGKLIHVPEKWSPLDVVFLYFLPALPFQLDQILRELAKLCSPGAKLVISHPQGRGALMQQRERYPDVIVSDLPDKSNLEKAAAENSFEMAEFVDEPGFYLAVLKFCQARS